MNRLLCGALTFVSLSLATLGASQPTVLWSHRYDGPTSRYDGYQAAEIDQDGNTYLVGLEVDGGAFGGNPMPLVMKVGPAGNHLWTAPVVTDYGPGNLPKRVVATPTALYVAGTISATGLHGTNINQSTLWKFDVQTGTLLWRRVFTDAPFGDSIAQDLAIDSAGNIAVCGTVYNDGGFYPGNDAFIQKFSPSGTRLWSTIYNSPINGLSWGQGFHFVKADTDGNFIVAGTHSKGGPSETLVHKYDGLTGEKQWETVYEGDAGSNTPNTLLMAQNGDPIIALNTQVTLAGDTRSRIGVMRLASGTGAISWFSVETLPMYYQFSLYDQVALDPNDNVVATLMYDTDGNGLAQYRNNNSMRTFKFDANTGARVWAVDHGNSVRWDEQHPRAIRTDSEGNVYVIGVETLPDPVNTVVGHTMIRRHDAATGEVTWYEKFVGEGFEGPFRARFDFDGNLIVAGIIGNPAGSQDFWVAKWNTARLRVAVTTGSVVGGNSTTGTVTLPTPAAGGQALVRLTDNSPFVLMSSNCVVPSGQKIGSFTVWTYGVSSTTQAVITATHGGQTATASLSLTPAMIDLLWLSPTAVVGGNASIGSVRLNGKAPAGGKLVSLSSSKPTVANLAATTTIAYGATTKQFPVSSFGVDATTDVVITATIDGTARSASLRVRPAALNTLSLASATVVGGVPVQATIGFTGKTGPAGRTVLLSSNQACAQVPATAYVPPQRASATFSVNTIVVSANVSATISATQGAVTRTAVLQVTP